MKIKNKIEITPIDAVVDWSNSRFGVGIPSVFHLSDEKGGQHIIECEVDFVSISNSLFYLMRLKKFAPPEVKIVVPLDRPVQSNPLRIELSWHRLDKILIRFYPPSFNPFKGYLNLNEEDLTKIGRDINNFSKRNQNYEETYDYFDNWLKGRNPRCTWETLQDSSNKKKVLIIIEPEPSIAIISFQEYFKAIKDFIKEIKGRLLIHSESDHLPIEKFEGDLRKVEKWIIANNIS